MTVFENFDDIFIEMADNFGKIYKFAIEIVCVRFVFAQWRRIDIEFHEKTLFRLDGERSGTAE